MVKKQNISIQKQNSVLRQQTKKLNHVNEILIGYLFIGHVFSYGSYEEGVSAMGQYPLGRKPAHAGRYQKP